jgi:hypothetical protein
MQYNGVAKPTEYKPGVYFADINGADKWTLSENSKELIYAKSFLIPSNNLINLAFD